MSDEKKTSVIHTRVPKKLEQQLKQLVSDGYYSNVSDALRDASRKLIEHYKQEKETSLSLNSENWKCKECSQV